MNMEEGKCPKCGRYNLKFSEQESNDDGKGGE